MSILLSVRNSRFHCGMQEKYEQVMIDGREKAGVGEIMLIKTQIQKERDRAVDEKVCRGWGVLSHPPN